MSTGKTRMINKRSALFMKEKSGYVTPVFTYLFLTHLNRKYMKLLVEPNLDFNVFNDMQGQKQCSFMITDK